MCAWPMICIGTHPYIFISVPGGDLLKVETVIPELGQLLGSQQIFKEMADIVRSDRLATLYNDSISSHPPTAKQKKLCYGCVAIYIYIYI